MNILDRYGLRDMSTFAIEQQARSLRRQADLLDSMAQRIIDSGES